MGSWLTVLSIIVTYCSGGHVSIKDADKCRLERMSCTKRAVVQNPTAAAEELISACLADTSLFPTPTPIETPAAKPSEAIKK